MTKMTQNSQNYSKIYTSKQEQSDFIQKVAFSTKYDNFNKKWKFLHGNAAHLLTKTIKLL